MQLTQLLAALPRYQIFCGQPETIEITALTADSRQVQPGSLFMAYRGVSIDGHRFIPQAIANGAAAIMAEDPATFPSVPRVPCFIVPNGRESLAYLSAAWHNFPARRLALVGVTGTDGKTTTTHLIYHILRAAAKKVSMINTVSAVIGDSSLDTGLHTTTPDAPDLQRYLAHMVDAGAEFCVLEVTSHGLAQHRVTACDFDIAVVTNITHEHLDLHGSLDTYRAAKAMLFESLAAVADKGRPKLAVLNCDDSSFDYLKAKLTPLGTPWVGYSLTGFSEAAITAQNISYGPDKTRFTLGISKRSFDIQTTLVGDFNVSNCLAAAAAALVGLHIDPEAVARGLTAMPGVPGRLERIDEGQPFLALVDFAHTPNSLRRVLSVARQLTPGRVIAVFGCAGLRDVEKRVLMGRAAAELADYTVITAEDPRTETLDDIMAATAQAMQAAGTVEGVNFERVADRGRAIYRAAQLARPGDVVLALGKGHEQSMCFGNTEYPWDDRQAMRAALRGEPLLTLPTA